MSTSAIHDPGCPYQDDPRQQDLEQSVNVYNAAEAQRNVDLHNLQQSIDMMDKYWDEGKKDGNSDMYGAALMVAMTAAIPGVTTVTTDDQLCFASQEDIGSSLDAMNVYDQNAFDAGESDTGMTQDQAQGLYEDQANMWWDLNSTSYSPQEGEWLNENYLSMIDPQSKAQLTENISGIMNQYDIPVNSNGVGKHYNGDTEDTIPWIQSQTNAWWDEQGGEDKNNNPNPPAPQITTIGGLFAKGSNTTNYIVQSANSNLQTAMQWTNTYVGNTEQIMSSQQQEEAAIGNNLKSN